MYIKFTFLAIRDMIFKISYRAIVNNKETINARCKNKINKIWYLKVFINNDSH